MKKNEKSQGQAATVVASGAGSVIGAAAGVVGGTFLNQELHAAEAAPTHTSVNPLEEGGEDPTAAILQEEEVYTPATPHQTAQESEPAQELVSESGTELESELQVQEYERGEMEDGTPVEMAVVGMGDQEVMLADLTNDGVADIAATDVNNDGVITEDEVFNVQSEEIPMEPIADAYEAQEILASNTPDYVNDGDVADFSMA